MKLLVIGRKGQLGWELNRRAARHGFAIEAVDLPEFDLADPERVAATVAATEAEMVLNAAAYTAVDKAETEVELAYAINEQGVAHLAAACSERELPVVHVSTDYVFDGTKQAPYLETDPVAPVGVYGNSKAAGETRLRERQPRHLILRTAWLYGVHGQNFVKTMLRLGREREHLRVVSDQIGCPTSAADLAEAMLRLADHFRRGQKMRWGTYHFCGAGRTSWHGFAEAIFGAAAPYTELAVKRVEAIPTEAFPTPARRPANSVLDCSRIARRFNVSPRPWREGLHETIAELFERP
jgi:dTDP-4-dehydrorhamnose reductase